MRGLTKKERRAIELEIKKTEFNQEKLRIIVDHRRYKDFYTVNLTMLDNAKSQILFIPFKTEPDIKRIVEQLKRITPVVTEAAS
jgi:hypothetical protein